MPIYRVSGEEWGDDIQVHEGHVVASGEMIEWAIGYEWKHIKRYFEQYGYDIIQLEA